MEQVETTQARGLVSTIRHGSRALKGMLTIPGVLSAAYVWLALYVILAVPLWVAFLAAGCTLAGYAMLVGVTLARGFGSATAADPQRGDIVVGDDKVVMNPLVDVPALRLRFALGLALMLMAGWLIVETQAFAAIAQQWISFACGIALTVFGAAAAVVYTLRSRERKQSIVVPSLGYRLSVWQALGATVATLGAWQIAETVIFSAAHARWLTFENACVYLALALVGLIVHEFSSEHVVHVLEVAGWRSQSDHHETTRTSVHAA